MKNSELLPCPMCRHEAAVYEMPNHKGWYKIRCLKRKCRVSIKSQPSLGEAVLVWNTRAPAERVTQQNRFGNAEMARSSASCTTSAQSAGIRQQPEPSGSVVLTRRFGSVCRLSEAVVPKYTHEQLVEIVASKIFTAPTPYGLAGVTDAVDTLIEARALQVKE